MTTVEKNYLVNTIFVTCNYLEDLYTKISYLPENIHDFKIQISDICKKLKRVNTLAENVLKTEEKIDKFDNDKKILKTLIDYELASHSENRQEEFMEYIQKFFEQKKGAS